MNLLRELFEYRFMLNAVLAAILASIACGFIGTIIVEKKLVSISGGIAHASFGGIGLGYLLNFEPIFGALLFAIFSALSINFIKNKASTYADTIIGIFWSVGMSLGIIFIALTPGYAPNMSSYLFGNILTVSSVYLTLMFVITIIIVFVVIVFFNYWQAFLFDKQYCITLGINTKLLENILMILIALCVVSLVKVVGVVLSLALFTIPPAITRMYTFNFKRIMAYSCLLGVFFTLLGLCLSYIYDIPSGATIVIASAVCYGLACIKT